MKINIFGSTGIIGSKTLELIHKYFPKININLLCAGSNYKKLLLQVKKFNPNFIYLQDETKLKFIKNKLPINTKILNFKELNQYLKNSKSDLSILAISGYKSLYYLEQIINNTDHLGLVSKEAIVSAGHIFKKKKYFNKTNIFPIDSEHFSVYEYFTNLNSLKNFNNIILTASGGPFLYKKYNTLKNVTFSKATKHPKWKMGYKNSIDSATLVNKCLEVIEAHYLFDLSFSKIKVIIHPEAIVHSIIENKNHVSNMILFKNDMSIPIINFLKKSKYNYKINNKFNIKNYSNFNFIDVSNDTFPIYKYFLKLNKNEPSNLIKFNIGNEYAVNLFKNKLIKYTDIYKIIKKVVSLNLYYPLNNIKDVINYHEILEKKIHNYFSDLY